MNLQFFPSPRPDVAHPQTPLAGRSLSDADVLTISNLSARISATTSEKTAALAALEAACAEAERQEVMLGTGSAQSKSIQDLVQQITALEARLEYLNRAYTGLGGV